MLSSPVYSTNFLLFFQLRVCPENRTWLYHGAYMTANTLNYKEKKKQQKTVFLLLWIKHFPWAENDESIL